MHTVETPNIIKKRSVIISGHSTSVTLEAPFWDALRSISREKDVSINHLISDIDNKNNGNLSSAIRIYVLQDLQSKLV